MAWPDDGYLKRYMKDIESHHRNARKRRAGDDFRLSKAQSVPLNAVH